MVHIAELAKRFQTPEGGLDVFRNVTLSIEPGECFVLMGPSGSGKTTLLRCLAGLEDPTLGVIAVNGRTLFSQAEGIRVPAQERDIGMVFQSYAIWPHLTVLENVALPLRQGRAKLSPGEAKRRAQETLEIVNLADFAHRPAPALSGGQQQRVAIARALADHPSVLLMDEPLSNLDAQIREDIRRELKLLFGRLGTTVVYVTHDSSEAMALADRIAVMDKGTVLQVGTPEDIYRSPSSRRIANLFGPANWVEGEVYGEGVFTELGVFAVRAPLRDGVLKPWLGFRPEHVQWMGTVSAEGPGVPRENSFTGRVMFAQFGGSEWTIEIQTATGRQLEARIRSRQQPVVGSTARFLVEPDDVMVIGEEAFTSAPMSQSIG